MARQAAERVIGESTAMPIAIRHREQLAEIIVGISPVAVRQSRAGIIDARRSAQEVVAVTDHCRRGIASQFLGHDLACSSPARAVGDGDIIAWRAGRAGG